MSYIAYKGFDKNLSTSWGNVQYQIGGTYSKANISSPQTCSSDGFHYCDRLIDTYNYYGSMDRHGNRFCEIEILGNFTKGGHKEGWKNVTTSFRIIRELTSEERKQIEEKERAEKNEWEWQQKQLEIPKNLKLQVVKEIQERYPTMHIGGSAGLFLHGVKLERWAENDSSDLDMVSPYFVLLESRKVKKRDTEGSEWEEEVEITEIKQSGNDFDNAILYTSEEYGSVKVDIKIDPEQVYEIIEYEGFRYKVSKLETIMEAKLRYAMQFGGEKHRKDIYEICGKKFGK